MDILIKVSQFILSLSLLIVLHELGHFIPAKLFKTKIEKFYLFFDLKFSLFKKKIGDTEWGIGWLPLGGYVKIAGMVDESMDTEQLKQPAQPWEFRSKPTWQRLIIMLGGVTVNVIVGFAIYIGIAYYYGEERIDPSKLKAGMAFHPYLAKYGLTSGDNILSVEGEKVKNATDLTSQVLLQGAKKLKVKHTSGKVENIILPDDIEYALFEKGALPLSNFRTISNTIDSIIPKSNAEKANLKKDDQFLSINNKNVIYFDEIQRALYENKGKKVSITLLRAKDTLKIDANVTDEGTLGYQAGMSSILDSAQIKTYLPSFTESISLGIENGNNTLINYVGQLKFLFTKKGASSLGGFVSIGKLFPPMWDWRIFWATTAFISIALAFMNILPIPALDGGHVLFLLYEIITGKEAPQKVLEYAQYVGIAFLLGLMIYANGNDVYRLIFQ